MSTTLQQALNAVNMADFANSFPEEWLTVSHEVNEDDLSLDPAVIRQYAEYCSLKEECIVSVEQMAEKIQASPFLTVIFQNIFRAVFLKESSVLKNPWPDFQNIFGEQAPLCYLLIALGIVPHVQKLHQKHNVSEKVSRDTCYQIRCFCNNYEIGKKSCGIYLNQLRWLRCYMDDGLLYLRFNRLEFMTRKNYLPCYVFQHKTSQKIITFNGCSMAFDQNGFALAGMDDPETVFVSSFEMQDNWVQGTTVDKQGRTSREISKIFKDEWNLILSPDMPVLDMHIPSGGGMTPERVQQSLTEAKKFYMNLPDSSRHPVAVVCNSWIFNPNLPDFLPEQSNLCQLLKRVCPVPVHSGKTDGLWFIYFHEGSFDLTKIPRISSLQKSVAEYIEAGNRWRCGAMFLPIDQI